MKTRLIDADKLVDSLRASMNHGRETFPVDLIVEAIDEQPTTKYIEQISRDDIEDICFKLTCYYIATTELYDRSLTDERRVVQKYEPKLYKAICNIFKDSYEYTRQYKEFIENMKG